MASLKKFQTLVPLNHKGGTLFEIAGTCKVPKWFYPEYLPGPTRMYVEPSIVEIMFGKDGEHIPHVESMLHTVIHVNVWGPEKRAEIWIFGSPSVQRAVAKMLSNVAHFSRMKLMEKEALEAGEERLLMAVRKVAAQATPVEVREAATQLSALEVREAATHSSALEVRDAATQPPVEVRDGAT